MTRTCKNSGIWWTMHSCTARDGGRRQPGVPIAPHPSKSLGKCEHRFFGPGCCDHTTTNESESYGQCVRQDNRQRGTAAPADGRRGRFGGGRPLGQELHLPGGVCLSGHAGAAPGVSRFAAGGAAGVAAHGRPGDGAELVRCAAGPPRLVAGSHRGGRRLCRVAVRESRRRAAATGAGRGDHRVREGLRQREPVGGDCRAAAKGRASWTAPS